MTKVIVDKDYLIQLIKYNEEWDALQEGGVDNWDWYDTSLWQNIPKDEDGEYLYECSDDYYEERAKESADSYPVYEEDENDHS